MMNRKRILGWLLIAVGVFVAFVIVAIVASGIAEALGEDSDAVARAFGGILAVALVAAIVVALVYFLVVIPVRKGWQLLRGEQSESDGNH